MFALVKANSFAQLPQLPSGGATTYNVQTMPAGSLVIAMDHENQNDGTAVSVSQSINITNGSTAATLTAANNGVYVGMTMTATGVPAGTKVVAKSGTSITMSNAATATASNRACTFGSFAFNMKAYGLLVDLLNNNKHLKWVIRPSKLKNEIDFSANTQLMTTSATISTTSVTKTISNAINSYTVTMTVAGSVTVGMEITGGSAAGVQDNTIVVAVSGTTVTLSNALSSANTNKTLTFSKTNLLTSSNSFGAASNRDFRGGPFVIFKDDTAGVADLVAFYNQRVSSTDHINVYRTTADVDVDVRFDYLINGVIWKPKVAILDDGGNGPIHEAYMPLAGISNSNGFANWAVETTPAFTTKCYTLATEPHNANTDTSVANAGTAAVITSIKSFVQSGGNFLAQCHAIWTYENYSGGRFMTKYGVWRGSTANNNATVTNETFFNSDLPYGQSLGQYQADDGGSVTNWKLNPAAGNAWMNNEHPFVTGALADGQDQIRGAAAAKLTPSNQLGGMVFYVGNHKFDISDEHNRSGLRFYMNAVMTPTDPQGSLQTASVIVCQNNLTPTKAFVSNPSGPAQAYPLTFQLFWDQGAAGPSVGDVQEGSTVTFTGPNTPAGVQTITAPFDRSGKLYYVLITPAGGCLQSKWLSQQCSNTLPVDLVSFTAKRSSSTMVNLKWTTGTEQNNKGFYVERLIGSLGNWETVGFVMSSAVGGNSSSEINYSFNDANNAKGMTQYRLRQVDLDNRAKLSEIRSVLGDDQKGKIVIYPNPSNDGRVNVVFDETNVIRDIAVSDMSGRMIKQMKGITSNNIKIDNLTPGVYTIRIVVPATGDQTVQKFVVNKR